MPLCHRKRRRTRVVRDAWLRCRRLPGGREFEAVIGNPTKFVRPVNVHR